MKLEMLPELLRGNFDYFPHPKTRDCLDLVMRCLTRAFVVHSQNVHDWILEDVPPRTEIFSLTPRFKLPFPEMFFEWRAIDPIGVLLAEAPKEAVSEFEILQGIEVPHQIVLAAAFIGTRRPLYMGNFLFRCQGDGQITDWQFRQGEFLQERAVDRDAADEGAIGVLRTITPALCSISFFHCKNVTIRKVQRPSQLDRKFQKRHGFSMPSFHVIEVHKATKHSVSEMQTSREVHEARASFVRGHFKNFTEDGKLFGKLKGLWFWDMHVRGGGMPLRSEYRPWPSEGHHKKECIVRLPIRSSQ